MLIPKEPKLRSYQDNTAKRPNEPNGCENNNVHSRYAIISIP